VYDNLCTFFSVKIANRASTKVNIALANNENSEELVFELLHEVIFEEVYQVHSPKQINWINGTAEFYGLSINSCGDDHRLNFTTDVELPGGSNCLSNNIVVKTGPPHALLLIEEQNMSVVYGGKIFIHQPLLHIVDAGQNILESDSSSRVFASLYSNPGNRGILQPSEFTFATAKKGVVSFENLYIAKAAQSYRLQYTLERTNITTVGK
jgi:hypothetical protein